MLISTTTCCGRRSIGLRDRRLNRPAVRIGSAQVIRRNARIISRGVGTEKKLDDLGRKPGGGECATRVNQKPVRLMEHLRTVFAKLRAKSSAQTFFGTAIRIPKRCGRHGPFLGISENGWAPTTLERRLSCWHSPTSLATVNRNPAGRVTGGVVSY